MLQRCDREELHRASELGANKKIVQRVLRHAKPHVTKDRYIKAFHPAALAAEDPGDGFGHAEAECSKSCSRQITRAC